MPTPPTSPSGPHPAPPAAPKPRHDGGWVRAVRNATFVGLAVSLAAHAVFLLVALYIQWFGPAGPPPGGSDPVEFAVVSESQLAEISQEALESSAPAVPELAPPEVPEATLAESIDAESLSPESLSVAPEDLGLGAGDIGTGADLGGAGSGGGASFFGVEAKGSRFAYIVDVSGSMSIGGKIEALRDELTTSIDALSDSAEFCVFLYSSSARALGDRADWAQGTSRGRSWARRLIAQITADGATNPLPAFELAHALRPRPDAIYFMTDGEFNPDIVGQILTAYEHLDIPIHCITFVNDAAEAYMRRLATATGGTYTHIGGSGAVLPP